MQEFQQTRRTGVPSIYTAMVMAASLAAVALSIGLSGSALDLDTRTGGFALIIAAYLAGCAGVYRWHSRKLIEEADSNFEGSIDRVLHELDETNLLIAGSLNVPDLFRLVANRINDLVGCSTSTLLLLDESRRGLNVAAGSGTCPEGSVASKYGVPETFAEKCMTERSVVTTRSEGLATSVAIPLTRNTEAFGVLQLFFDREPSRPLAEMQELFESIGERVSPLVLSSMIFQRNQRSAMTDSLTDLPNERAFHLILEQQIAETVRDSDARPLSVLAVNVRDFDMINSSRGHASGDGVLNFVARTVRENLRQMDFFARCRNDEFLAVLPTASEETAYEVIERIETALNSRKVDIAGIEPFEVRLNFGWAVFGRDGETPKELLARARTRRDMSSDDLRQGTVLMFRK